MISKRISFNGLHFFDKKITGKGVNFKPNQQLANELHKPIVSKFKRRTFHLKNSSFKDNIWGVNLADMRLISKYNKRIRYYAPLIVLVNMHWLFL